MDESFSMDQQEEQLIANTERMERTSRKLQDAYRIAIETEEVSIIFFSLLQLGQ